MMTAAAQLGSTVSRGPSRRLMFGVDGQPIPLKPKVFDTLLFLIEHRGELVDKQALLEGVGGHAV